MGAKVPRHINLHSGSREGERFVVDSFSPFYTVQGPHKGNGATYSGLGLPMSINSQIPYKYATGSPDLDYLLIKILFPCDSRVCQADSYN